MPQKYLPFSESQDGRRKLSSSDVEEIRLKYKTGNCSHRSLGREYGVHYSRIGQLVNPKTAERMSLRIKEHWRDYQTSGAEWASVQRKLRAKKRELGLVQKAQKT